VDDPRSDEFLEECGRVAWRLGLALAWTDGLEGEAAKACSRGGSAHWQRAKRLPEDEEAAIAFFKSRARKRNPVVPAGANNLCLLDLDGDLVELCAQYELWDLPGTVAVRSKRGLHLLYRPPAARAPMKVQIHPKTGITVSADGYLVGAGALHPDGIVYRYESRGSLDH
jgi:hypothetical protein